GAPRRFTPRAGAASRHQPGDAVGVSAREFSPAASSSATTLSGRRRGSDRRPGALVQDRTPPASGAWLPGSPGGVLDPLCPSGLCGAAATPLGNAEYGHDPATSLSGTPSVARRGTGCPH